jgi:glutathione peroxidase
MPTPVNDAQRSFATGTILLAVVLLTASPTVATEQGFVFPSIDGGQIDLADWRGKPVLVVNTASLCGYVGQFDDLQALQDRYGPAGLKVLAVPSDDFAQELADAGEVKSFCDANFDLTLPMTDIQHVKGAQAHPFYVWVADQTGFVPRWNFNKVLLDGEGRVVDTWGAGTSPQSPEMTNRIEALLP